MDIYLPLAAVLFDLILGDPRTAWHPVVLLGKLIAFFEQRLLNRQAAAGQKRLAGGLLVLSVLLITFGTVYGLTQWLTQWPRWFAFGVEALLASFVISPRSLAAAGREIRDFLVAGNLEQARYKVGWIVGRDTAKLDVAEITRATVETIAENIVDGIIAPLFYLALGGLPWAFLYRAVNTMDSMIGYKNEKYLDFGMIAARIDDIFNYLPARITGLLLVLAAWLLRYDAVRSAKTIWWDAPKHPSPNSGIPESATAGALGIRLGGLNYYGGVASHRAHMGDGTAALRPEHITRTSYLMYVSTALFVLLAGVLTLIK